MANVEGKATAITVLTPIKREGPLVLWAVFWAGRRIKETLIKLQQLSFIHYARWVVIDRFPDEGHGEKLGHEYLLFESNFNGTWDQYIDAFSEVVPFRMKAIWGTSYGFPARTRSSRSRITSAAMSTSPTTTGPRIPASRPPRSSRPSTSKRP